VSVDVCEKAIPLLVPLHRTKRPSGPHDWLANHKEKGQTFAQYIASDPIRPTEKRDTLFILLLGDFTSEGRKIVELTVEFMGLYFNLPVKLADSVPLSAVPDKARRGRPHRGEAQINASYVLDEILVSRVPENAVALIAFTASDLWPRDGWNFVFGLASLHRRVGVWSINRFGDPTEDAKAFRLCLLRTLKVGTHETGHMLGIKHCIAYECNMNGSNHLNESDQGPMALCPQCAPKIWWNTGGSPVTRYAKMEAFCRRHGLNEQADFYKKSAAALEALFEKRE
jgi:archaemetzincin